MGRQIKIAEIKGNFALKTEKTSKLKRGAFYKVNSMSFSINHPIERKI